MKTVLFLIVGVLLAAGIVIAAQSVTFTSTVNVNGNETSISKTFNPTKSYFYEDSLTAALNITPPFIPVYMEITVRDSQTVFWMKFKSADTVHIPITAPGYFVWTRQAGLDDSLSTMGFYKIKTAWKVTVRAFK